MASRVTSSSTDLKTSRFTFGTARGRRAPRRRDHIAPPARHGALAGERRAGARAARPLTQSRTALQESLAERAHQDQRLDPVVGSETRADEAQADVVERVGDVDRPRARPYPLEGGARARLKCSGQHDPRARKRDAAGAGKIPTLVDARQFPAQLATLLKDRQSRGIPPTSLPRLERSAPCPEHRKPPRIERGLAVVARDDHFVRRSSWIR